VFFTAREGAAIAGPAPAADAALSFAEGMGFLFDEDWVNAADPAAERIWEEFASGADSSPLASHFSDAATASAQSAQSGPNLPLTKFRHALPRNPQQSARSESPSATVPVGGPQTRDGAMDLESQLAHRGIG
jgi:hypothetical protein